MKENKTLDDLLCFSLYSVTNAFVRQYRPLLQEMDLTYPQFVVLMALYEKDNIPLRDLSDKTFFDSGTLTPLVQKLEAKGFLNRIAVVGDERMKNVVLTDKAKDINLEIRRSIDNGERAMLSSFFRLCSQPTNSVTVTL